MMREKRRVRLNLSEKAFRFAKEIEATAKETGQHPDDILRSLSRQAQDLGDRKRVSLIREAWEYFVAYEFFGLPLFSIDFDSE